ncbi:DUF2085 domain-containing protein [Halococcoides cellulosivorans]|uniref:DUF2085 domain-containing protein n=1 Tax=Halococcoides cellulosivorans TaxID=1679096 RepID=A0A2R4X247_9EURY|nr:DUF2085 domain-containing protein [Halococcoides cellulosivorans]AWB27870.1 hypothetical protein HARCEL1_09165 [Halococcoides cellulosivorans]
MRIDRDELRAGLRATTPYLLAHHTPDAWDHCYRTTILGRTIRLCARCLGIYPGVLVGLVLATALPSGPGLALVAVGPLPALLDWTITGLTDRRGVNPVRTATGAALGIAYGVGLWTLVVDRSAVVFAVGVGYALLAVGALVVVHRKE